jgi:signal transduction histidine kinase
MVTRIAGGQTVGMSELIDIADETQELIETSRQLAEKSAALERTARQLRVVNERLRTLDAQKDEFLSQVSHELRTPMTSVRSFAEILIENKDTSPETASRFLSIIHDESIRLTRLLDEILDISSLEAGRTELILDEVETHTAVMRAIDTIAGITHKAGVNVEISGDIKGLKTKANDDRLRQVLINILSNAVKYNTSEIPNIHVRTHSSELYIYIDIIDNGGGVSREEASSVFEKFARGSSAGSNQGAGLGLPISRAIMRAMNGDLTLEFASDGSSFFRISLAKI